MLHESLTAFSALLLASFIGLLTIVNPPSTLAIYTSLTAGMSEVESRRTARSASLYCLAIMVVSLFAGSLIMKMFGISYPALRIAGGLILASLGHGMLYGKPEVGEVPQARYGNPAFFPLAMPGITGPGTIAVTIGFATQIREYHHAHELVASYVAVLLAMVAVCTIEYLLLRSAHSVMNRLGVTGIEVMTRLSGFLLICVGVQFVASGTKAFMAGQ